MHGFGIAVTAVGAVLLAAAVLAVDRARRRERPISPALVVAVAAGVTVALTALGLTSGTGRTVPPSTTLPAPSPCVRQLTTYVQDFIDGKPELGDYQELGLSAAEGRALRDLRAEASRLASQGPIPSDWVDSRARAACAEIARTEATASGKPGWP